MYDDDIDYDAVRPLNLIVEWRDADGEWQDFTLYTKPRGEYFEQSEYNDLAIFDMSSHFLDGGFYDVMRVDGFSRVIKKSEEKKHDALTSDKEKALNNAYSQIYATIAASKRWLPLTASKRTMGVLDRYKDNNDLAVSEYSLEDIRQMGLLCNLAGDETALFFYDNFKGILTILEIAALEADIPMSTSGESVRAIIYAD